MSEQLDELVRSFHFKGYEVSKIAKRLKMSDDEVREIIVARWEEEKREAAASKKFLGW